MIRYPVSLADLEDAIDADPKTKTWRKRAARRTAGFIQRGCFDEKEGRSIWSEVKPHYLRFQYGKCAYCEQQLETGRYAPIAYDLEHFRPKSNVRAWPEEAGKYPFPTGDACGGYYRLAYHPGNYVAACKICNTQLKSDFFPIAGSRIIDGDHPDEYVGDDPEDILAFIGIWARPRYDAIDDMRHRKARVMIDFFDLNREGLRRSRAHVVRAMWGAFRLNDVEEMEMRMQPYMPHTSCARCFCALCEFNPVLAGRLANEAKEIIHSLSR